MKPCFGYIRVSTQKQGEGVSLEAQKDAITDFASRHQLTITEWFEEQQTAAKGGRPVFNRMIRRAKRGEAKGIVIHKIDRSARNLRDWTMFSELPDKGVEIFVVTESLDFTSRGGRLTADLLAVIAADYIRNLRDETIKGLNGRLKQGLYPFRAPIGYLDNGRGQPKTPCPVKAPLVRQAFDLYASGQHSLRSLQTQMERLGLRNHVGQPICLHGIETILNNRFYTGVIEIKRTGAVFEGVHEPIITAKTFARVQDVKAGKAGKKTTRHNHLYRGLFRCGLCGGPMSPERQKGNVYYRCQTPDCATKSVREESIDHVIQESLRSLSIADEHATKLEQDWQAWLKSDEHRQHIRSLELRIAQTDARIARLTDLLVDGTIDQETYHERKRQMTQARATLKENVLNATKNRPSDDLMEKYLELIKCLAELHISANHDEKRYLVENCFSNRTVVGKNVELEPSNWLRVAENSDLSPLVTHNDTLLELLSLRKIFEVKVREDRLKNVV